VAIWLAVFFGVLSGSGGLLGFDVHLSGQLAAHVVPWTIGYFLLGYLMYASLYATIGVLTPPARDANHFVYLAIIPLVIPLLFNRVISGTPNGALATTLSLFPLTSPIAMVARLGSTTIPWWQTLAGLVALALFAYGFVLSAARLFRAENVLSTRALTWTRLRAELQRRPERLAAAGGAGTAPAARPTPPAPTDADAPEAPTAADPAAQPPGRVPIGRRTAPSKQRSYLSLLAAAVLVGIGVIESVRGQQSGIIIAVAGVLAGLVTYWRRRR